MSLYGLKPRFVRSLDGLIDRLAERDVSPDVVTMTALPPGIGLASVVVLGAWWPPAWLAAPILALMVLALNAIDGQLARTAGKSSARGAVLNELVDRVGDILLTAPAAILYSPGFGAAVMASVLAAEVPPMIGWAIVGRREFGGPMGKPDRALWISTAAFMSFFVSDLILWVAYVAVLVGSVVNALERSRRAVRAATRVDRRVDHVG